MLSRLPEIGEVTGYCACHGSWRILVGGTGGFCEEGLGEWYDNHAGPEVGPAAS